MKYEPARARGLLALGVGRPDVAFREGQEDAIRRVVEGRGPLLLVQATGWGKSFVYFIATKLLREGGFGPALLVSPLLALMRNQIAAAERMGVRAIRIASDNTEEWDALEAAIGRDEVDILLISPERFANERFQNVVLGSIAERIGLLVIDEAHCISDWGHDFRPDYRLIERFARTLPGNFRLLATTATANDRVLDDLRDVFGSRLTIQRGRLDRPSLLLQTIRLPKQSQRMAWLAQHVPSLPGSGIIYTLTIRDAERLADWLRSRGLEVDSYSGDTGERREELEQALLENRVKALVATTALGMGFDKPDLGFVIHYQTPGSVVAYYQQVGRAGRALDTANCVLLSGEEETDITNYFITSAFPTRNQVRQILDALERAPDGLTLSALLAEVNISQGRVRQAMKLLALEAPAPVVKQGSRWQLTAAELGEGFWRRTERLSELRRAEGRQMQKYVALESGHMAFLIEALNGDTNSVRSADRAPVPAEFDPELLHEAAAFLRRISLPLEPRKRWPAGGLAELGLKGVIPAEQQAETGRILCVWGDAGWGEAVRRGKNQDGRFGDELVRAAVELVRQWNPQPPPEWVACIPSRRRPDLVPDFARRVAEALGLPFDPVLDRTSDRAEQKDMQNSFQQAQNVAGAFALTRQPVPPAPVLLLDDVVDSRWTLTVAAWLLRSGGCAGVWPLALAQAGRGS